MHVVVLSFKLYLVGHLGYSASLSEANNSHVVMDSISCNFFGTLFVSDTFPQTITCCQSLGFNSFLQMFAVVEFISEGSLSAVPGVWLIGDTTCFWPPDAIPTSRAIANLVPPTPSWEKHRVVIKKKNSKQNEWCCLMVGMVSA